MELHHRSISASSTLHPRRPMQRPSCDRCHAIKERCVWFAEASTCARCTRLHHVCESQRELGRPGRRPKKPLVRGARALEPVEDDSPVNGDEEGNELRAPHRESPVAVAALAIKPPVLTKSVGPTTSFAADLSAIEQKLLVLTFERAEFLDQFLLGPSFTAEHQRALKVRLHMAMSTLKDSFLASAAASFPSVLEGAALTREWPAEFLNDKAARAISTLRTLRISDRQQLSNFLLLGVSVITFAPRLAHTNLLAICQFVLGNVYPFYQTLSSGALGADESCFLNCLLYTEIIHCLFEGQVPVFRSRSERELPYIDRFLGVLPSLLPLFYDLCKINAVVLESVHHSRSPDLGLEIGRVRLELRQWQPTLPTDFLTNLTSQEVVLVLEQAQIMRVTALLILHRIQYCYDSVEHSSEGQTLANLILSQLELASSVTGRPILYTDLPFIVCCLEIDNPVEQSRLLKNISQIIGSPIYHVSRTSSMLSALWHAKRNHPGLLWGTLMNVINQ